MKTAHLGQGAPKSLTAQIAHSRLYMLVPIYCKKAASLYSLAECH